MPADDNLPSPIPRSARCCYLHHVHFPFVSFSISLYFYLIKNATIFATISHQLFPVNSISFFPSLHTFTVPLPPFSLYITMPMPESQPPSQDPRHNEPTTRGRPIATYSAATRTPTRPNQSARYSASARSIAVTWSSSPVQQVQPHAQGQMSARGRGRGTSQSQSQGRGRVRGKGQSGSQEYNHSFAGQIRTTVTGTAPSDVYSVEHDPTPPAGDGLSSCVPSSPAPSFSSGYPPLQTDFLDSNFVQDVRVDDNGLGCSSAFSNDREASSGPSRRLELQGDSVGADSQRTGPDNSDSNLLGQSSSSLTLSNEVTSFLMHSLKRKKIETDEIYDKLGHLANQESFVCKRIDHSGYQYEGQDAGRSVL